MSEKYESLLNKFIEGAKKKNKSLENAKIENSTDFSFNTCLALTYLAVNQLAETEDLPGPPSNRIAHFKYWLIDLDFGLSEWNEARVEIHQKAQLIEGSPIERTLTPAKRNSKDFAVWDCVEMMCLSVSKHTWLIHPSDMGKLPPFTTRAMILTQYEVGLLHLREKLVRDEKNSNNSNAKQPADELKNAKAESTKVKSVEKKKQPFNKVLRKNLGKTSKSEVIGNNPMKIGIRPVKIGLHARVLSGGSAEKLTSLLKRKSIKTSNIQIVSLFNGMQYSTYQIQLEVPIENKEFWKDIDF